MPRLFFKIFIWFWATVIVTGISVVLAFILEPQGVPEHWHASLADTGRYFGTAATGAFEHGGAPEAALYLRRLRHDAKIHACVFDITGAVLAGEQCSEFAGMVARVAKGEPSSYEMRRGLATIAISINGSGGHSYIYASELLAGPLAAFGLDPWVVSLRACIALLVSGLICYFLTRHLTTPILRLRAAAQQITGGKLGMRADTDLELRRDEFGDLVREFNRMAARSEDLISSQRQLLFDVSHEIRSPLARMSVALDLLRRHPGEERTLARMDSDLRRLNEMVERLLTVARLEANSTLQNCVWVNLSELVSSIAGDAEFEAQERGSRVEIVQAADLAIFGDVSLLRSAIENVLRNAVRFTQSGTAVEVLLRSSQANNPNEAIIVVRDHGAGVPQDELTQIFKPFFRATDSGRDPTGAGLGLAIADRVVRLHKGRIYAKNEPDGGLRVEMIFPC